MAAKLDPALVLQERLQVNRLQLRIEADASKAELERLVKELKKRLSRATGTDAVIDLYALALIGLNGLLGAEKSLRGAYLASLREFAEIALTRLAQKAGQTARQRLELAFADWQVEDAFRRGQFEDAALFGSGVWRRAEADEKSVARYTFALTYAKALLRCGFAPLSDSVLKSLDGAPPVFSVEGALLEASALRAAGAFQAAVDRLRDSPLEKLDPAHELVLRAGFSAALCGTLATDDHRPLVTFCRQNARCPPPLLCLARIKLHGDAEKNALALLPKGATLSRKTKGPGRTGLRIGRMVVAVDKLYDTRTALPERVDLARHTLVAAAKLPSVDEECLTKAAVHRWLSRSKAEHLAALAREMIVNAGRKYSGGKLDDPYGCLR